MKKRNVYLLLSIASILSMAACQFTGTSTALMATQTPIILIATSEATLTATPAPPTETPIPVTETPAASATATATETPTVTQTTTPLPMRAGGVFYAQYMYSAPVIDGVWDEWGGVQAYTCNYVVYGGEQRTDSADLGASVKIGWDWNYLYLATKISDDIYAQNASGQDLYKGDSLELLFDSYLFEDFYWAEMSNDDYQLGISPGNPDVNGTKEAVVWYPRSGNGSRNSVVIGSARSDGVTRVEAAIPWSVLGVSPYAWAYYGFAFSVSDNDDTSSNYQQSMVSCVPGRSLTDPTSWGEVILVQ
jgi:hypothetical protein